MSKFNLYSKQCPACGEISVEPIVARLPFTSPTHRCVKCDAELKSEFTSYVLWSIPICIISLGVLYFGITWLQQSLTITGTVRAGLAGGLVAICAYIPTNVARRGIVVRVWNP
jgi:hypothetical protein